MENKEVKAKHKTLTKVNSLMTDEQKDLLDHIARKIMRNRSKGNERITGNTVLRSIIDAYGEKIKELEFLNIEDETSLTEFLKEKNND